MELEARRQSSEPFTYKSDPDESIGLASFTMVHLSRLLLTALLIGANFAYKTPVQTIHSDWREIALRVFDLDTGVKAFPASGDIHATTMNLVAAFDRGTVDLQSDHQTKFSYLGVRNDLQRRPDYFTLLQQLVDGFVRKKSVFAAHGLLAATLTGLKALNESAFAYGMAVDRAVPHGYTKEALFAIAETFNTTIAAFES
ncbi:hypothetical protein FB45DRAFT_1043999 [Roridomyces roridus]|uniref:Uncharacterized protein n=1 Tax=Roridomyces roridus TaxID=1738132 RepID=A0AAD7AYZ2_9AGAR|nr:hypothetical protein FB45DRAFT_1043999 [Roridomyces roridus]